MNALNAQASAVGIFAGLLGLACCFASVAAAGIPFEESLRQAHVTLTRMQDGQRESLMLGNGDLYGIVWQRNGALTLRVTKNDIWDARVDTSGDGPLPKVDIGAYTITGGRGAPPSYKKPYPHPRCAAAIRFGDSMPGGELRWSCIRGATEHAFASSTDGASATMRVSGGGGASTGYRATLVKAVRASSFVLKIKGSANASYYVDVYSGAGKNIFASGWTKSPTTATRIELKFPADEVRKVDLFAMTSDGRVAENHVESMILFGADGETKLTLPTSKPVRAELDLRRAMATVHDGGDTTIRILADRNVVLIRTASEVALEAVSARTLPAAKMGETGEVAWLHQKLPGDANGDWGGMEYALALAAKGDLKAVSLVSSYDRGKGDVLDRAIALAGDTLREREPELIAAHEEAWEVFWSRSGIELADKAMERWWYRTLYFARTVCKPGAAPVALMPPLATDATPWHADYHHNYNSWQAFWPLPALNHPELADPWISYVNDMLPRFQFLARATYGCDGVFFPISSFLHEPDPAVCKSKNKRQMSMNPWGLTIGMVGMTIQSLWQKHLCDPDPAYLEAKVYPTLREGARFYVSFMEKCKRDKEGRVVLGPSYSPEHGPWGIANCPFDIAYVRYTFDAFVQAADELGRDADLAAQCRKRKRLLPAYPTTEHKGEEIVVDWQGGKHIAVHNITVPATPVFPADQVTWFSSEPEKALFRRTIKATRFNGNNSQVMFNIAKARLSMPEGYTDGRRWFVSMELPNGLFVWKGHAHGTFMGEMIGIAGLINEFLLQSVGNKIRLFPWWPEDKDARFVRLRAQGGFIVSAEFKGGRVASATIESVADRQLQLLSPWSTLYVNGRTAAIGQDGVVTVSAKRGQVFRFSETGN
ncbi:MAG: glycosyl hydrolase family 95 catalytic domain-containing protein [Planctomycetota bacterium]|jgi:hypothetical protein